MSEFAASARSRALLAFGLAFSLALCLGPIYNPDLGWHLTAGARIVATHAVPRADFMSWTKDGVPWVDFEWGAQLILNALYRLGGLWALWSFKVAAFFALSPALVAILRLWEIPDEWIGCALPPFALALFPVSDIRPEIFSLLLFMLQFYALERRRLGRPLFGMKASLGLQVAGYALWANLHAGFPTGLMLCGAYGAAEAWRRGERPGADSALAWTAAGAAGTLLNPYGPALYGVFLQHWHDREMLRRMVIEWGEPNFFNGYMIGYWMLIAFSFVGFIAAIAQGAEIAPEHFAAFVLFGFFSSRAFRTTAYSALALFPLSFPAWRAVRGPSWWPRARVWAAALGIALAAWRAQGLMREERYLHPLAVLENYGPAGAVRFIKAEKAQLGGLRICNPWNWGGYLDWYLSPDTKVFMDGRYLFTGMLTDLETALDRPGTWRRYLDERSIDLVLLSNDGRIIRPGTIADWRPFIAYAMPRSDWALVYWDTQSVLLVRRSKVPADWLKAREYRLLRPHDARYVGLLIASGVVPIADVQAEIDRYEREIDDPMELLEWRFWIGRFREGLDRAARSETVLSAGSKRRPARPGTPASSPKGT